MWISTAMNQTLLSVLPEVARTYSHVALVVSTDNDFIKATLLQNNRQGVKDLVQGGTLIF
jgi:hypothetical protein